MFGIHQSDRKAQWSMRPVNGEILFGCGAHDQRYTDLLGLSRVIAMSRKAWYHEARAGITPTEIADIFGAVAQGIEQ